MAKKFWDNEIDFTTDWGGDISTDNLPVSGNRVQEVIKKEVNSKVGYVGLYEEGGYYVLCRDEKTFNDWKGSVNEEKPFGDESLIVGRFDAPYNYSMKITLLDPQSGYKSSLAGSTGNEVRFYATTVDKDDSPVTESITITIKVTNESGVSTQQKMIYDYETISNMSTGVVYQLDGKLSAGRNTISITAVGMNTGASSMKTVTYNYVDMYFVDRFDIVKPYQFDADGDVTIGVGYSLKGVGRTMIHWFFDGQEQTPTTISNENPILNGQNQPFYFNKRNHEWLTVGVHNIQMYMECTDINTNEKFYTPIYYREFVIEDTPTISRTPYIMKKGEFEYKKGILSNSDILTVNGGKEFENTSIQYGVYYNGQANCVVETYISYNGNEKQLVISETINLQNGFSLLLKKDLSIDDSGTVSVFLRAKEFSGQGHYETEMKLEVEKNDMKIQTVEDNVVLFLNAFGRTNSTSDRDKWEYKYTEGSKEHIIETKFSENEYVLVSTLDDEGNVIKPEDATDENSEIVNILPYVKNENKKYLIYNNEYYVWTRAFDWSDTSGWSDNKLKIGKENMITIDFKPFSDTMVKTIKERGATFEFEFETTNVYDDNAVICRICGNKNYAPGISIYAAGAEMVISREIVESSDKEDADNTNAGYMKAVSTKYKSEESNRISFVITPDIEDDREKLLLIYVNGECCGAYPYSRNENFFNDSTICFRGTEKACINISNIKLYSRRLSSNEILDNFIYYRTNTDEKIAIYKRNDIVMDNNSEVFDSSKLLSQLPVMTFYQINEDESIDKLHQEKKDKKLTVFMDISYIDIQNPERNFVIKNAYITPQGTSSMNYPVKNFRIYTGKKDKEGNYYSRLFVGSKIFKNNEATGDLSWDNINLESEVSDKKRRYAFKEMSIPVNCWCLKADFAESSSSHNTGTSRYWNGVLKAGGYSTKAQRKANLYKEEYPYDIRTAIDGFPIVLFYQDLKGSAIRFEGKYNFNNDKSTEDVFGFTGGIEIPGQECKYFYIGKEKPQWFYDSDSDEYSCSWEEGGYVENPTVDSPLYVSDDEGNWYMLRGKELLDNPKMECWELLNSVSDLALFKTAKGFGIDPEEGEKVGLIDGSKFDEAFESRYPDCGDYYHTNSLHTFVKWLVSCRYLKIDNETGKAIPYELVELPAENYYKRDDGKISIISLTKQSGDFEFNYPNYNFYTEVTYEEIASSIEKEGYQQFQLSEGMTSDDLIYIDLSHLPEMPLTKYEENGIIYEYIKYNGKFYCWMPSNLGVFEVLPDTEQTEYDFIKVGEVYYQWKNSFSFSLYHDIQWVEDTAFNRALKFCVEKYDHIEMNKMAAYYIYLMRFGGVDQTVKNSMLTTEGPNTDSPDSILPSLWYFINYDNDTILGVKNDGRLVFDPYITRETKDGTGYVYAGRESTLWNNLEADTEFMTKVTAVDNDLAKGEGDANFALSYNNALREYDDNQSDKWCERIYNKDAERKYLDTYVKGWTQHWDKDGTSKHVYEDYLYDVQGSRSAHRKWWLGRRFNIYDSKFCNSNFRSSFIKFRSTNLPSGSTFRIKSGEPIYYAWGHDNSVTEMTPYAIQAGDDWTFTTKSTFNIGSYLELMGAANMITLDLRGCVGDLTEVNVENCYSPTIGTKLQELLIGDHTRMDLKNVSTTQMNFGGLGNASRLEVLDITNIQNIFQLDGLDRLLNIREVYSRGSKVSDYTFANGAQIEKVEFSSSVKSISLTNSSSIKYEGLKFDGEGYGELSTLSIIECPNLMNNPSFILNWINSKNDTQKSNINLNLQGINWSFVGNDYTRLFVLEKTGTSNMGKCTIGGKIKITQPLAESDVRRFKNIFGYNCFSQGAALYIDAPTDVIVNAPDVLWEGTTDVKCEITLVGTTLNGTVEVSAEVRENINGVESDRLIETTNGIITMDTSTINNGYVTISIQESARNFSYLYIKAVYTAEDGQRYIGPKEMIIKKRVYPNALTITSEKDAYNNFIENTIWLDYLPSEINDEKFEGRGYFNVTWSMVTGTIDYDSKLILRPKGEKATIQAKNGFDGRVTIGVSINRNWDNETICYNEKIFEFTNPDTILTEKMNGPLYRILKDAGIIKVNESGFGSLTKDDASKIRMSQFVKENGESIFKGNKELVSFLEMQYFNGDSMGQMPVEGKDEQLTPIGMFQGCTNLKEIAFSRSFAYANDSMFKDCTNLEHIYGYETIVNEQTVYNPLFFQYVGTEFAYGCKKLKICNISNSLKTLKKDAFRNCESLEVFNVSANEDLFVEYTTSASPFNGCKNITFEGSEYDGTNTYAKCQVKNGALYEVNGDSLTLIHMGKNTLISDIPTDKEVIATSYSMEYRTEENIVVPSNIRFNGRSVFYNSVGNSVKLNTLLNANNCTYLFEKANYKGNYYFADNETTIPQHCFADCDFSDFTTFTIPSNIKTIESNAFNNVKKLKNLYFEGAMPPSINKQEFWGVLLDNIYVYPQYVDNYRENIMSLLKGFVTPRCLHNEGYVRIIKDGYFLFSNDENIITVGGLPVESTNNDYMKYSTPIEITDTNVYLNGKVIGKICSDRTTIYLGDNSMLFDGDGYNFTKGIYDNTIKNKFDAEGWFYDSRFEGVRSKQNLPFESSKSTETSIAFNMPEYTNKTIDIEYGRYALWLSNTYFTIPEASFIDNDSNSNGFNKMISITVPDGKFTTTFGHGGYVVMGIDGIVLNKIGDSIYSDPEIISTFGRNTNNMDVREITVSLIADTDIPESVIVTITDNKTHEYRKRWKGETLTFVIPNGFDFVVSANDFINGKKYQIKNVVALEDKEHIEIEYISKSGVEVKGNILSVFDDYNDWYICLDKCEGTWDNTDVVSTNVENIEISDADGYKNTLILSKVGENIFKKAIETNIFGENIVGYIPSYIEIMMFENNLDTVNDYLKTQNKKLINFNGCWTSESYDLQYAWTCDGEKALKTNNNPYYIFGKNKR